MSDAHHSPHTGAHAPKTKTASILSNILAIAGLILLVIVLLWGLLHLASLTSGWFASLFYSSKDTAIEVIAPTDIYAGQSTNLSWRYSPNTDGKYAFVYQCKSGLAFAAPANGVFAQIPCGIAFTLGGATSSIALLPLLSGTSSVSVPLTILYISSASSTGGAAAQGTASVLVHTAQATSASATQEPEATKPTTKTPATAARPADLAIVSLTGTADPYGNATVSFDIANIGGSPSGTYYFTAQLPTQLPYSYSSPAQASLAPGSHIISTLTFSGATQGLFSVNIGSSNDAVAANNSSSFTIYVPANQYPQQIQQTTYSAPNQQCYYNGQTYVCPQNQQYYYSNGLPYYVNSGQLPYIVPGSY